MASAICYRRQAKLGNEISGASLSIYSDSCLGISEF